jgi:hypothetical protein
MRVLTSFIAAGVLAAVAAPAGAAAYVAYDQFQVVGGAIQTGAFAAGTSASGAAFTGAITPHTTSAASCGGNAAIACLQTGGALIAKAYAGTYDEPGTPFYIDGFLNMHTGSTLDSVLQFIAPTAGTYNFAGRFEAHDTSPNGVTTFAFVGAQQQFAKTFTGGFHVFDFDAQLAAGDTVSFVLNAAGAATYDSTGLALTVTDVPVSVPGGVPEPATWAMMLIGFFGMGSTLRSRRRYTAA